MSKMHIGETPWDGFDAYLFDIDGTLIHCTDAVHYFAFCDALQTLSGRPLTLEGVTAHGNTDVGILRDALKIAGVAEEDWRPHVAEACSSMCAFVQGHKHELCATVLPYVREVLEHLRTRGATLGLATGNLKQIGQAKLMHAGLLDCFDMGGWSDAFETRTEVFRSAIDQMRTLVPAKALICVVGDTPADIQAAQANNLPVIAVATGVYSSEHLLTHAPDLCLQSFADLFSTQQLGCQS